MALWLIINIIEATSSKINLYCFLHLRPKIKEKTSVIAVSQTSSKPNINHTITTLRKDKDIYMMFTGSTRITTLSTHGACGWKSGSCSSEDWHARPGSLLAGYAWNFRIIPKQSAGRWGTSPSADCAVLLSSSNVRFLPWREPVQWSAHRWELPSSRGQLVMNTVLYLSFLVKRSRECHRRCSSY